MLVGGGRYGVLSDANWKVIRALLWCCLPVLLWCGDASAMVVSSVDQEFDHLATGYPLVGKHAYISCETCHNDGVFKGLPTNCEGCHNGLMAFGQPPTHIPTNEKCDACHDPNGFTIVGVMDHSVTALACVQCHNGVTASGKVVNHLPTANACDACHVVVSWTPVAVFDHSDALGTCAGCHDGVIAEGKSRRHIASSNNCDACHNTISFTRVTRVDHNEVLGTCSAAGCHEAPLRHVRTTQFCDACHSTHRWVPVVRLDHNELLGSCADSGCHVQPPFHAATTFNCEACHATISWTPLRGPVAHSEVIPGRCMDCHPEVPLNVQGIVAPGQPLTHIPTNGQSCDICHTTASWIPALFTHAGIVDNCVQCHTLGINATPKPVTHLATSDLCENCHNAVAWTPVIIVDHSQVNGTCCHNGSTASGKSLTHIQTLDECDVCHITAAWTPAAIDHSGFVSNCITCHDGVGASGKSPAHINTGNLCDSCHDVFPARWAPVAANRVDHTQVNGSCVSCHNNTPFSGKPPTHITTTDNCDACHAPGPLPWAPVAANAVDHAEVLGVCSSCHNGSTAVGKLPTHVVTNDECDVCHNTSAWLPATATPDHSAFVGNCVSCHNGTAASGKGPTHIATSDVCDACHDKFPAAWTPVATGRVDHTQVRGLCVSCHNNSVRPGKSAAHMATSDVCDACHLEGPSPWTPVPAVRVDHLQVLGTCASCHNGVTAAGKSLAHILTTDNCDACHAPGPTPWAPLAPSSVDHFNVIGACVSCHLLPGNHCNTGVFGDQCDACHVGPSGGFGSSWRNTTQSCPGAGGGVPAPTPVPGPAPAPGGSTPAAVISQPTTTSFAVGQAITFSGDGSFDPGGAALNYAWDFGDGFTASGANPAPHVYTTATSAVTVALTVDNGTGGIGQAFVTLCISGGGGGGGGAMGGMGGPGGPGVICP